MITSTLFVLVSLEADGGRCRERNPGVAGEGQANRPERANGERGPPILSVYV